MSIKRRDFLTFLGLMTGSTLISSSCVAQGISSQKTTTQNLSFTPIKTPIPLDFETLSEDQQKTTYSHYEILDDLLLPENFTYDLIGAWGDPLGNSRFGYNNDYLSFIATGENEGLLTINFEYISGKIWRETYPSVIKKALPFDDVQAAANQNGMINGFALPDNHPLKDKIKLISQETLIDLGIGIISIRRNKQGKWERTYSKLDRRITGISGLKDGQYLSATGPAIHIFKKANKQGYDDQLGEKIVGTFQNCAGGTSPWGTVFSAEENFQDQVPEPVRADGSSFDPSTMPFIINDENIIGSAHIFGLAGNKYGWMVEIDPTNPQDSGTKHTWLGRYRHEAVGFLTLAGKPLAVYSGCDRRGGHFYKFVSKTPIKDPKDKNNSRLLEEGMLYGAKFNPDGTGEWIPLTLDTPVNPVLPSQVLGRRGQGVVPLPNPNRIQGGIAIAQQDEDINSYKAQFKTLGELYDGNPLEQQGAILIDAHFAANAAGVTCTARPEDIEVGSDGTVYIAYTSGTPGSDGGPDKTIFKGPKGETPYEFGWIMSIKEDNQDPASMTFRWRLFATGGEPAQGGLGFSNPDNLAIDKKGNLWMVTDMPGGLQNAPVTSRSQLVNSYKLIGVFGNNTAWFIPTSGENAGNAYPFAMGPVDCELTGPCFNSDDTTLFISVQHPGEAGGIRQNMNSQTRSFLLTTPNGTEFTQERIVPIGSNWPSEKPNQPPRPAVVAIRRKDNQALT